MPDKDIEARHWEKAVELTSINWGLDHLYGNCVLGIVRSKAKELANADTEPDEPTAADYQAAMLEITEYNCEFLEEIFANNSDPHIVHWVDPYRRLRDLIHKQAAEVAERRREKV